MGEESHKIFHHHDWSHLFPMRSGIFSHNKHAGVSRSTERIKHKKSAAKNIQAASRLGMRRGSSMSELDKLANGTLPDLVRSTTASHQLSTSPASLPHSPYFSRSGLLSMSNASTSARDSIGMNPPRPSAAQEACRWYKNYSLIVL